LIGSFNGFETAIKKIFKYFSPTDGSALYMYYCF
jgi:hypothetical protein